MAAEVWLYPLTGAPKISGRAWHPATVITLIKINPRTSQEDTASPATPANPLIKSTP